MIFDAGVAVPDSSAGRFINALVNCRMFGFLADLAAKGAFDSSRT